MTEVFGPFEGVTIEQIVRSWDDGQKHQMAVMINYYGNEFWYDFAKWILAGEEGRHSRNNHLFVQIVISYNAWYPHPQQLPGGEKLERPI